MRYVALILILVCTGAWAGTASLSWSAPTQNDDGSPLTNLAGYRLYQSSTQGGPYSMIVDLRDPGATSYEVTGLGDGTYYFVATAYNAVGTESRYSGEASKTVTNVPEPPLNLTVTDGQTTVFSYSISEDALRLIEVGTAPPGTPCDGSQSMNGLYLVPRASVQWIGSVRPLVNFAACGPG